MAALIGNTTRPCNQAKSVLQRIVTILRADGARYKRTKPPIPPRSTIKWKWEYSEESLASRGFLRPLKPYQPSNDVSQRLDEVCKNLSIPHDDSMKIEDLQTRFKIFVACEQEFSYSIPNSRLCGIETIGDVRTFYQTPINTTLPLDAAKKIDLPPNLHIQYEYNRFHPATDTKFGGKTAFPGSSTIVTGLRYKKKYKGHSQKSPFHSEFYK